MKTTNHITKRTRNSVIALASIVAVGFLATGPARAQYGAAGHDGITASPRARAQLDERNKGASAVSTATDPMVCAKCKDGWVTLNETAVKGAGARALTGQTTRAVAKHLCEGCGVEWNVSGTGKAKQVVVGHKCIGCGTKSLACCFVKGAGTMATGMDQKMPR